MILLTLDHFKRGFHFIALNNADVDPLLQDYIDRYEASFIKRIFGVDLGEIIIEEIQSSNSGAIEERIDDLIEAFMKQVDPSILCRDGIYEYKGLLDTLAGLVYCEYISDTAAKHTLVGVTLPQAETAGVFSVGNQITFAEMKWNDSWESIEAVQWFCRDNKDIYPEYKGIKFNPRFSPLL